MLPHFHIYTHTAICSQNLEEENGVSIIIIGIWLYSFCLTGKSGVYQFYLAALGEVISHL